MKRRWQVQVTERRKDGSRLDWFGTVRDLKAGGLYDWKARRIDGSLITLKGFHGGTLPQPVRRAVLGVLYQGPKELEIGVYVRVKDGFTYAGKPGRIVDQGTRPDGRVFWTVRLDISTSTGSSDREYYSDELTIL